jgi:tetratricopeptide (TPR) repeat protein
MALFLLATSPLHASPAASPRLVESGDAPVAATLEQAMNRHRSGQYAQALAVYRLLLDSSVVSSNAEWHAYVLSQIADVNIDQGMYEEAITRSREAVAILRMAQRDHTGVFAKTARILADALYAAGYDEQAKEIAEQALSVGRQTLDTRSPDFAFLLTTLAQILKELGKFSRAEELCQSALQILQRTDATYQSDLATAYQDLAVIQALRGHPRKASVTIDLALATWSHILPPTHPSVVYALSTKIRVCTSLKAFRQGEALIPQMLALSDSLFGRNHPERVSLLNNAAAFYVAEKRYGDAELLLHDAAEIARHQLAPGHPRTRSTLLNHSYVLRKLNRKDDAARARAESEVVRAAPARDALFDQRPTPLQNRSLK